MINKRGAEVGKIISSFPVLIAVFLVMGLFVFASATLANYRSPDLGVSVSSSSKSSVFLFEETKTGDSEMIVMEIIQNYLEEESDEKRFAVRDALVEVAKEKKQCLFVKALRPGGSKRHVFDCDFEANRCGVQSQLEDKYYRENDLYNEVYFDVEDSNGEIKYYGLEYYFGECVHSGGQDE